MTRNEFENGFENDNDKDTDTHHESKSPIPLIFPAGIDSTMLSAFGSCPQKFLQEFIIRRVPIGKSIHLHAGGCFASAMESIRVSHYKDKLGLEECLLKAWPEYVRQWGDFEGPEKEYKDFVNMWAAIEAYFQEYPLETDNFQPYMKADGSPAVEFKFAIPMNILHPISGDPIMFCGRADQLSVLLGGDSDAVYVTDEKTTKALGSSWQYQWDMRGQFYGYTYAARQMGYNCAGALVRGIAIQQTQFGFQEKVLFYTEHQLNRWWYEAHVKVRRMIDMYVQAIHGMQPSDIHYAFDMSFGEACNSYGGCQFVDLCRSERPWDIYKHYEERVWNPLANDPTEGSEDKRSALGSALLSDLMDGM